MRSTITMAALAVALSGLSALNPAQAQDQPRTGGDPWWKPTNIETFGNVELEGTGFFEGPAFPGQERDDVSFAARPTLLVEWLEGDLAFTLTPFYRWDLADERRTHFDLREAKFDLKRGNWSFTLGNDFVFWGRTEALQLVDIVNSDDAVEDVDGEDKLGQPMLRVTYFSDVGAFSAFYLPFFREPTIPGVGGRLRPGLPIIDDEAEYRVDGDEFAPSFALRWEHVVGDFDFGVSAFYGVSRDAAFAPLSVAGNGAPLTLRPVFDDIAQIGFDGQFTSGPALWKLETLVRFNQLDANLENTDYFAITAGLEYTFFGVAETAADLGVIVEGAYDTRGDDALTPFEQDAVYGLRLALNDPEDTQFLIFGATDVVSGGTSVRLEAERRVFESWKVELESQLFVNTQDEDIEADFADDSFVRLKLKYFW